MGIIKRNILNIIKNSKKSILLLGPRQTGKSTLLRGLAPDLVIDLADEREYLRFARNPDEVFQRLEASKPRIVFIDEVQRIPSLLNSIQSIIDTNRNIRFLLSGSSARKLARGQANLLPGRVIALRMGPLIASELEYQMNQTQALGTGTLPGIFLDDSEMERLAVLDSYAATYVKEEVQAEALTRNLEGFSRFLFVAASRATDFLDYTKLANTSSISRQSAIRFFEILEETLIAHRCEPFTKSGKRRLIQHPRYFFFDTNTGYVFASLQYLMKQQIKRKFTLIEERIPGDSQYERNRIVSMEERVAFDLGEGVASGQLGTQILSLDPVAKRFRSTQYLYNRDYSSIDHISQERRLTARVAQQFGTRFSREAFIVTNSHQSTLPYVTERESSIQQSYRRRQDFLGVETAATADISSNITVITVHGDSTLHAGDTIEIMVPITGDRTIRDRAMDNLASGKYLVTAVAHRITTGGLTYVTVLECVKDAFIKRVENIVRDS